MASQQQQQQQVDPADLVGEFDRKLDRLKILYEQYFMGIEKREPLVPLKDVVRIMRELDQLQIRNTGVRYRYRNLVQKFNTYRTYWNRILRSIENGTYQRDIARLSRNLARKGVAMPQLGRAASRADVERAMTEAVKELRDTKTDTEKVAAIRDDDEAVTPAPQLTRPGRKTPSAELIPEAALGTGGDEYDEDEETNPGRNGPVRGRQGAAPPQQQRPGPAPTRLEQPALPRGSSSRADLPALPETGPLRKLETGPRPPARELPGTGPLRPPPPEAASRAAVRPTVASNPPVPAIAEAEMRSLYRRFVKAKEMCGEDVSKIRYESLVKSISQQLPKIQAEHGREVEFQVVIREGRAILRAKPK